MKAFLKALAKEGVLSIVVLVILCVLVWFGGSLFADEDNDLVKVRIIIIVVLLSIWVTLFIVQKVMAIRNAQKIEAQLKAQAGAHLDGASADQKDIIDEMRQKFDESLSALKKTKGGKSALFTLPWYVIIGPPGSGKTTALQESGLNFPASEAGAKVKGIGGTRNCDWWFTEDGILLDTAGRYTTVADDNKEWLEFLDMIRIGRKTKPINGAIVAMSLDDVLRGSQAEIDQMARDIGNRVAELSAHLNAVFPVYVLFTKADLVKGFVEFFEDFTRDERNQAWGWTFPFGPPDKQYITVFDEKMAELNERIEVRRMELLSTERPDRKKESIYLFPSQMRLAQKKMREFMGALFSANTFQESTILRGVYLTSGTQDGTPIDQILARMNSVLGVEPVAVDESRIEKKSFFIHNLFKKIIFKDKVLARSSSKLVRKRQAIRLVVQGFSVVALALMLWVSVASFVSNKDHINSVEDAAVTLSKAKDREKLENLEKLRAALEPLLKQERDGVPLDERWGMYQGENMLKAGARPYLKELSISFTNDVRDNIEKELITSVNRSGDEASKRGCLGMLDLWRAYRMMCGQMEVQPELVVRELQKEFWNKGDSQDSALANRQLAFYAELLEYSNKEGAEIGIFLKPNSEVEAAAKGAIERGGWLDDVYFNYVRKAGQNLSGSRYKKLDPEVPHRLTYRPDVANRFLPHIRAYTQDGWDNYLKEYLDDALTTLRDMHKNLNVAWDEGKMHNRLHKRHAEMIDQVWADYLSSVHLDPTLFDEIDRTAERLERLGQRKDLNIDAMELVKSVEKLRTVKWQNNNVSYSTPAKNVNLKSLDAATGNLGKFIEAFV
ncbi:MAG: type VI secretion system membrane subunit TssM, partial [Planctomycetes bacterium]|nr:type VI secretion system membrane subunit TssM [Planctomycetota bacterium]